MILPGNIFFNKEMLKLNNQFHVGHMLLLANVLIYFLFFLPQTLNNQETVNKIYQKSAAHLIVMQKMYQQTMNTTNTVVADEENVDFFKDRFFWSRAQNFPFYGDVIEIEKNKKLLNDIKLMYENSNQYQFGLSHEATTPWAWLTYQFTHAGIFHLLTNMIFLFLITNILVKRVESDWILSVYIIGGVGAGISYLLFSSNNEVSMVGASGSLCALIAFLATTEHKKNIQWSYFLSPIVGGYGLIYLPAYLLFPIYLASDFTTVLYHSHGIDQSVAHSAHIGGALTGFVLGFIYLADQKIKKIIIE